MVQFSPVPAENQEEGRNKNCYNFGYPLTEDIKQKFMSEIKPICIAMEKKYGIPAAFLGGQAVNESGFGLTRTGYFANNYCGLKFVSAWGRKPPQIMDGSDFGVETYQLIGQPDEAWDGSVKIIENLGEDRLIFDEASRYDNRYFKFKDKEEFFDFLCRITYRNESEGKLYPKDLRYIFDEYRNNIQQGMSIKEACSLVAYRLGESGYCHVEDEVEGTEAHRRGHYYRRVITKGMDQWNTYEWTEIALSSPIFLEANWFEANRTDDGKAVVTAYNDNQALTNLYGNPSISVSELRALLDKYPKAENILVAQTDKKIIPDAPRWPEREGISGEGRLKGVKILLDAGHSKSRRGAGGLPPDYPDEWEHNVIACQVLKEALEKEGAYCHYEDPDPDNLEYMGQLAKGYDIAIYSHHNAFDKDGVDEGTGIYIHPEASSRCKDFCKFAVAKVAAAVGNYNRGITEKRFTVLQESYEVGCPISLLPEYYFIDDYGNTSVTKPKTRRAAEALAQTIIEYFGKN